VQTAIGEEAVAGRATRSPVRADCHTENLETTSRTTLIMYQTVQHVYLIPSSNANDRAARVIAKRIPLRRTEMKDWFNASCASKQALLLGFGNRLKILGNVHSETEVTFITGRNCCRDWLG
jgi:hypothetical protein